MEMERDERAQFLPVPQGQQGSIPAHLYVEGMTLAEKAKYGVYTAVGAGLGAEVLGFGVWGVLVGVAAGGTAAYFSEEIRNKIVDRLPSPKSTRSRRMDKINWFITGREPQQDEDQVTDDNDLYYEDDEGQSLDDEDEEHLTGLLNLGPAFQIHADMVFSNRLAILGMPGAGKTNAVSVLAEELAPYGAPLIIFDHKPEYGGLCHPTYFPNGYRAGAHNLTPDNAFAFAFELMNMRLQVVIDLRSYKDDNTAALVMINLVAGIWAWEEALHNDDRIPCTLILDEAHYWLPQADNMSTVNRQIERETGHSLYSRLQQTFFNVVNGGRSFGIGIILSTQRPANIDKRAISVAEWKLLLKANMPQDLSVYKTFGLSPEVAQALGKGEAYVIGPNGIKGQYQMRKRYSPDESKTPGLAALKKSTQLVPDGNRLPQSVSTAVHSVNVETPGNSMMETPVNSDEEPDEKIINDVFPPFPGNTGNSSSEHKHGGGVSGNRHPETAHISEEIRESIRVMNRMPGYSHREIASLVGLSGRKYGIYQFICAEEGIEIKAKGAK